MMGVLKVKVGGSWIDIPTGVPGPQGQQGPKGDTGATGSPGPAAGVSADANNVAKLGTDSKIYVPDPPVHAPTGDPPPSVSGSSAYQVGFTVHSITLAYSQSDNGYPKQGSAQLVTIKNGVTTLASQWWLMANSTTPLVYYRLISNSAVFPWIGVETGGPLGILARADAVSGDKPSGSTLATVTATVGTSRRVRVFGRVEFSIVSGTVGTFSVRLYRDGAVIATMVASASLAQNAVLTYSDNVTDGPAAGARVYSIATSFTGAGVVRMSGGEISVEDIGQA